MVLVNRNTISNPIAKIRMYFDMVGKQVRSERGDGDRQRIGGFRWRCVVRQIREYLNFRQRCEIVLGYQR